MFRSRGVTSRIPRNARKLQPFVGCGGQCATGRSMVDVTSQAGPVQAPCICGTPFDDYVGNAAMGDHTQWFFAALLDHGRRVLWGAYVTGGWWEPAGDSWLTVSTEMNAAGALAHLRDPAESPFRDMAPFSSPRPLLPLRFLGARQVLALDS